MLWHVITLYVLPLYQGALWCCLELDRVTSRSSQCPVFDQLWDIVPTELDMGVLQSQINSLHLDVSVAWIGPHLHSFVHQRTVNYLATLFFNWMPNTLTAMGNYSRISFPHCKVGGFSGNEGDKGLQFVWKLEMHMFWLVHWDAVALV